MGFDVLVRIPWTKSQRDQRGWGSIPAGGTDPSGGGKIGTLNTGWIRLRSHTRISSTSVCMSALRSGMGPDRRASRISCGVRSTLGASSVTSPSRAAVTEAEEGW